MKCFLSLHPLWGEVGLWGCSAEPTLRSVMGHATGEVGVDVAGEAWGCHMQALPSSPYYGIDADHSKDWSPPQAAAVWTSGGDGDRGRSRPLGY